MENDSVKDKDRNELPHLLTLSEVSGTLRVSRSTVYRLVEGRRLPAYRLGRRLRFDRDDVATFLARRAISAN